MSVDRLLGGRVTIEQPAGGLRASLDPVLLAATVDPPAGALVVELGTGSGVALACVLARRPDLSVIGIERDIALVPIAQRNLGAGRVVAGDVAHVPLRRSAAWVLINPPYHAPASSRPPRADRRAAVQEDAPLTRWIRAAAEVLMPNGRLSLIHRADRLPMVLAALHGFGQLTVLPLWPRAGVAAKRVLIGAIKGSKAPAELLPGLVLHEAGSDFTPVADAILRDGAALPLLAKPAMLKAGLGKDHGGC
jgi:tRNA1(Val) A37 N6-methylase TrmN6